MSEQKLTQSDYESIEKAMLESERGRWFLVEFAKRNRNADTGLVLEEIRRMHDSVLDIRESSRINALVHEMEDMRRAIEDARKSIAAIKPRNDLSAQFKAAEYDTAEIPAAVERATHDIIAAVERLRGLGQKLREDGTDEDICDEIETHARGIFMAASFQDMTGQRTLRLLDAMRYLDQRINAVIRLAHDNDLAAAS